MKKFIRTAVMFFALSFVFTNLLYADGAGGESAQAASGTKDFAGLKFGVGVSLTMDTGKHDRIKDADLDENGIVRITKENNNIPRIMLESHYLFTPNNKFFGLTEQGNWGIGPFVALQPGTDQIIEAIGMGIMAGFKRNTDTSNTNTGTGTGTGSWNFGLGLVVDPNNKILGDGIYENEPLPAGETKIRFKETSQLGFLFLFSFTF